MVQDHHRTGNGRLLRARLSGIAHRGGMSAAGKASGAAELKEADGDHGDLLAEVAGLALGWVTSESLEYQARGQTGNKPPNFGRGELAGVACLERDPACGFGSKGTLLPVRRQMIECSSGLANGLIR